MRSVLYMYSIFLVVCVSNTSSWIHKETSVTSTSSLRTKASGVSSTVALTGSPKSDSQTSTSDDTTESVENVISKRRKQKGISENEFVRRTFPGISNTTTPSVTNIVSKIRKRKIFSEPEFVRRTVSSGSNTTTSRPGNNTDSNNRIKYGMIPGGLRSIIPVLGQNVSANSKTQDLRIEHLKDIYNSLFDGYDTNIRPRLDLSETVTVATKFVPLTIMSLDTVSQIFTIFGYFQFEWEDEVLAVSRLNQTLTVSSQNVWKPSIQIQRATTKRSQIGNMELDLVVIRSDGVVKWVPEGIYSLVCEVNTQHYPFDVHTCTLTYYVEEETTTTVNLEYFGTVDLTEYVQNAEWNLLRAYQETRVADNMTFIDIHFVVERRGIFDAMTTLAPVLIMSMLSTVPFLLPVSSGEKCIISVMIFFGYTIFMTIMIDSLPHNSLHMSYLVMYVLYLLFVSVVFVFYSIIQQKLTLDFMYGTSVVVCRRLTKMSLHRLGFKVNVDLQKTFRQIDTWIFFVFTSCNMAATVVFLVSILKD